MNISDIASIVAIISSIGAVWIAFRKTPFERANLDASAAKSYAEAAESAAMRAEAAEKELVGMKSELSEIKKYREEDMRYIAELLSGIERLLAQMKAHKLEPVWKPALRNLGEKSSRSSL
jgi:hypothetical protein